MSKMAEVDPETLRKFVETKEATKSEFFAQIGLDGNALLNDGKEPLMPEELQKIVPKETSDQSEQLVPSPLTPDVLVLPEVAQQQQRMLDDNSKSKKRKQFQEWKDQYDQKRWEYKERIEKTNFVKQIVDETEKVEIIDSNPPRYLIYLKDKKIELPAEELLNSKSFIVKYLCLFHQKILIKPESWGFLLEFWATNAIHIGEETLTEESALAEEILQKLAMRPIILIENKAEEEIGNSLILDKSNGVIYVPNYVMAQIIKSISPALRLNKVRFQLSSYLKGNTSIMRVGKMSRLIRAWQFDAKHFELKENT